MKGNNRNNKYGYKKQQIHETLTLTAHDRKLAHDVFLMSVEWLEKYVEVVYKKEFPNWENRKQVRDNLTIKRTDIYRNHKKLEETLSTQLALLESSVEEEPLRDELKQEFYKWISATGIDANNCPEKLKHYLFGVNEILEGRGGKILKDAENRERDVEMDSPEYLEQMSRLFTNAHSSMRNEREVGKSLEGKTHTQINIESKFGGGNAEQGEQVFNQISSAVTRSHNSFRFYPQKEQQSASIHPTDLNEVVQEVKATPQNWMLDEVATEIDGFGGIKKQELVVYCRHARLYAHDEQGKLIFNNNPIYLWENFNSQQRFEIKRVKNISGDYLVVDEIKWVIREFKENPGDWKIGMDGGQTYLIHNSAQGKDKIEFGTLIHNQQKFSREEWTEINRVFERVKLIDNIKQSSRLERNIVVFDQKSGKYSEADDWFVHNEWKNTNEAGSLIFNSDAMIRVKDLNKAEQKAVGYNKSEQRLQEFSLTTPQKNDNKISTGKVFGVIGIIGVLLFASVAILRKRLNNKSKD